MTDGIIKVDSPRGVYFDLTSDKFKTCTYLWKVEKSIYISFIEVVTEGQGYFRALVKAIHDKGYIVKVPTPFSKMRFILEKWDFKPAVTEDGCEVFSK